MNKAEESAIIELGFAQHYIKILKLQIKSMSIDKGIIQSELDETLSVLNSSDLGHHKAYIKMKADNKALKLINKKLASHNFCLIKKLEARDILLTKNLK